MEVLDKLVYGAGVNIADLRRDIEQAKNLFDDLGGTAKQIFGRQIANEFGRMIDGKQTKEQINKIRSELKSFGGDFGDDIVKQFDRTFGRAQAKKIFDPLRDESKSFFGQLKQSFAGGFDFKSIALGTAAGFGAEEVGKALLQAGADSIKFAADFERSLKQVQTIAEKDFNFDAVRDQIKTLSTEIPQDVLTLTQGLGDIIGAGVVETTQEAVDLLRISAKSATAGMTDTATASKAMVFVMNAFKDSNLTASQAADILFRTVDEGVISFTELANNIGEVAAPAALAGVSMEEVGAAIATITRGGINAAETMTAMKNLLGDIVAPTKGAAKAAEEMGLDFSKAGIEAAGGLAKFIQKIQEVTGGDTEKLKKLFPEDRALKAIQQLAGVAAEDFQKLSIAFLNTGQTAGAMDRAFQTVNKTATEQYQLFKNNLSTAVLSFGSSLLEGLKPALEGMNEWMVSFSRTGLEDTIFNLKRLGVEAEKLKFLEMRSATQNAETEIKKLDQQLNVLLGNVNTFGLTGGIPLTKTSAFRSGAKDIADTFKDIIGSTQGVEIAQQRLLELDKQFADVDLRMAEAKEGRLQLSKGELQSLNEQREYLSGQREALEDLLTVGAKIAAQREIIKKAEGGITEDNKEQAQATEAKATAERVVTVEKKKQLEIQQDFRKAVDAIKPEIRNTLPPLKQSLQLTFDTDKYSEEIAKIEKELKDARDRMADLLGTISDSFDNFLRSMEDVGINVNDRLLALSAGVADGLNSFLPALNRFKDILADPKSKSLDIFSSGFSVASIGASIALPLLKNVFGGLFGGDRVEKQRQALEQQQRAQQDSIEASKKLAKELEQVRRESENMRLDRLQEELSNANNAIREITGSTRTLTAVELKRVEELTGIVSNLERQISEAEDRGDIGLADLLRQDLAPFLEELEAFGFRTSNLTAEQLRNLALWVDHADQLNKAIAEFGKFTDTFAGKIDRFNLQVELFDIDSISEKIKTLGGILGLALPDSVEGIDRFVREAFAAFQAGGDTLLAFMSDANLNRIGDFSKMSAEEFLDFIKMLEGFGDQLGNVGDDFEDTTGDIVDKFSRLFDMLELEFDLFNVSDPAEQLKRIREDIFKEMNALIPLTQEGLDAFIKAGFTALQGGEDAVKALLANLNLEELTADQFKDLLRRLAGFARDAKETIDDAVDDATGETPEERRVGVVRQITFVQGNELIYEASTIRTVVTQMLGLMRESPASYALEYRNLMSDYYAQSFALERQQLSELIQIKMALREMLTQRSRAGNSGNVVVIQGDSARASSAFLQENEVAAFRRAESRARAIGIVS